MNRISLVLFGIGSMAIASPAIAWDCSGKKDALGVTKFDNSIAFSKSYLNVDADGAPNAYRVDGNGLSYTCDGVVAIENGRRVTPESDRVKWQQKCNAAWKLAKATNDFSNVAIFGFATDAKHRPLVQGEGDPLPGVAYITTTSVEIPEAPMGTQRRQIDATKIPYVVLPSNLVKQYGIKPAAVAIVYRPSIEKVAFAVYGDGGRLGEGSVKLHMELGSNPMILNNGVERAKRRIEDEIITIVFPEKSTDRVLDFDVWTAQIKELGDEQLKAFGGVERLKACSARL